VYLPSPVTSLERVELLPIVITVSGSAAELLFLYSSLNPKITPYMEFTEGNCQDARTLVEFSGVSIKVVGARLGPKLVSASAKMH